MIRLLIVFVTTTLLIACGKDKPTINYNEGIDTTALIDQSIKDTTKILVSELPVKFDSTDILLFPIALVDLEGRGGYGKISIDFYGGSDVTSSYLSRDNLSGNFVNMVFQDKNGTERKLTDKKIEIRSVSFLRNIFKETKTGYLLYSISDRDSNGDKEITHSDLEAFYISKIDGTEFRKLTKELHEFYDWRVIQGESKIHFRTLEDKNKDGELNNRDIFHYYLINFSADKYSVVEYNPVKIFE